MLGLVYESEGVSAQADSSCKDVQIIFARGSGSALGDNKEAERFFEQLEKRIMEPTTRKRYELGTGWPGYDNPDNLYPAVAIAGGIAYSVGLGAQVSDGEYYEYGLSVLRGVMELQLFLSMQADKCPNTKYVIGGYSQGAQVVGQALSGLSSRVKPNVVFVALFGDPKLNLPEGLGIFPPACRGEQLSVWRRDVPSCRTDTGTLGTRSPYVPTEFKGRVGLWCNNHDWICGSSKNALMNSGHDKYKEDKGAIDKATLEIARRLRNALPFPKNQYIDDRYLANSDGEARLNVAYIWDTSASSQLAYNQAQMSLMAAAEMVWAQEGRVSITPVQGDSFYHPMAGISGPFGDTVGLIAIGDRVHTEYRMTYYPYTPITAPTSLVMPAITTIDALPWQKGAEKAMVFIAESALYDQYGFYYLPSAGQYVTYSEYIARRALEIDPVNTYFIMGSDDGIDAAEYIANATGGKVVQYDPSDPGTLDAALQNVGQEITERPVVVFGRETYEIQDGEPVVFDISASYTTSGEITQYEWDYEGDGVWDEITTLPHATHTYPDGFSGIIHAQATDSYGRIGTMTAFIEPSSEAANSQVDLPLVEGIQYTILETENNKSTVRLTWDKLESVPYAVLSVNGVHLGHIISDRTSIGITEIIRSQDVSIDLQAMDANYNFGERSGVIVPALRVRADAGLQTTFSIRPGERTAGRLGVVGMALASSIVGEAVPATNGAGSSEISGYSVKQQAEGVMTRAENFVPVRLVMAGLTLGALLVGGFVLSRQWPEER